MAYAFSGRGFRYVCMKAVMSSLPSDGETIAELRELYRAAEARAARLRLLSTSGRELAEADPSTLDAILSRCAERLAFFVGKRSAVIVIDPGAEGIAIHAPGPNGKELAAIVIDGLDALDDIPDEEDREAVRMELELMGATIDRIEKESERGELVAALKEREKRLEMLLERIFTAQEEERRRVSHELHDGVAQTATALVRILEGAETAAKKSGASSDGVSPTDVARSLVSELRRVIGGLRPTLLDDLGLPAALQSLCDGLEAEGFTVSQRITPRAQRHCPLIETALFRVAQEAIANIHKHAGGPCEVSVEADLHSDPVVLRISDHGNGPSEETRLRGDGPGHNVGIEVMKERMTAIGGTLEWRAVDGGGVTVVARLPAGHSA